MSVHESFLQENKANLENWRVRALQDMRLHFYLEQKVIYITPKVFKMYKTKVFEWKTLYQCSGLRPAKMEHLAVVSVINIL